MSRYVLQAKNPQFECVVGWDAPLETFFAQVLDPAAKEENEFIGWWGGSLREIENARELVALMKEYAEIPEEILSRLEKDQAEDPRRVKKGLENLLVFATGKVGLFHLGRIVATPGAIGVLETEKAEMGAYLARHWIGDWGDMPKAGKAANDRALNDSTRIFSGYLLPKTGMKIWIITEADRSMTTILLPSEY